MNHLKRRVEIAAILIGIIVLMIIPSNVFAIEISAKDSPTNRWANDNTLIEMNMTPPLYYTYSSNGGELTVYLKHSDNPKLVESYYIGLVRPCPQDLTGKVCDRPPLISEQNPKVIFDTETAEYTGYQIVNDPYFEYKTFRDLVPNGETFPSKGDWDVPYNGRHYYGLVKVNLSDWIHAYEKIGDEEISLGWFYPIYLTLDKTVKPDQFIFYAQNTEYNLDNNNKTFSIEYGDVSVSLSKPVCKLGETLSISGTNKDTNTAYLWLTGPGLPKCGMNLTSPTITDRDPYIKSIDDSGNFINPIILDTNKVPVGLGDYQVWVSSSQADDYYKNCLDCGACSDYGTCALINCKPCGIYKTANVIFEEPEFTVSIDPSIIEPCCCAGEPCGTLGGEELLILQGKSESNADNGNKTVQAWLFGPGTEGVGDLNYLFKRIPVNCDGEFKLDINHDWLKESGISLCSLEPGNYTVIVQTPWLNQEYDVIPDTVVEGGIYEPILNKEFVVTSSPLKWSRAFQLSGSGSSVSISEIPDELKNLFNQSTIDDRIREVTFQITDENQGKAVNFKASPTEGNVPLEVNFTDTSTMKGTSWMWDFGDGTTSTESNPVHTYNKANDYSISLTVSSSDIIKLEKKENLIHVINPPVSNFVYSPQMVYPLDEVIFTDTSTNNPTSWFWNFGDNETSSLQNPTHIFQSPEIYNVELQAGNKYGFGNLVTKVVSVGIPVANFSISPLTAYKSDIIQFADNSTGNPTSWMWDFGDGQTSSIQSPVHSYGLPGLYEITLTIGNKFGIGTPVKKDVVIMNDEPVANFTANPINSTSYPAEVYFTDTSIGEEITSWLWSLGDGSTSTAKNPIHMYILPGVFNISLTVSNNGGTNTTIKENYITVGGEPGDGYTLNIYPKWNHFSIPATLVEGKNTVSQVFEGIDRGSEPAYQYSNALEDYEPIDEDTVMVPLTMYKIWYNKNDQNKVVFEYQDWTGTFSRDLKTGWNGIGITGPVPVPASEALKSLGDAWDKIIWYDGSKQDWIGPVERGKTDYTLMYPVKGYMIDMNADATLEE